MTSPTADNPRNPTQDNIRLVPISEDEEDRLHELLLQVQNLLDPEV